MLDGSRNFHLLRLGYADHSCFLEILKPYFYLLNLSSIKSTKTINLITLFKISKRSGKNYEN